MSRSAKAFLRTRKKPVPKERRDLMLAFGGVLKRLQKQCKLSDETLAKKSGIPATRIQAIAAGEKEPYLDDLFGLAPPLGIRPSEFLKRVYKTKAARKALRGITLS